MSIVVFIKTTDRQKNIPISQKLTFVIYLSVVKNVWIFLCKLLIKFKKVNV